jgi:hypothetical protein
VRGVTRERVGSESTVKALIFVYFVKKRVCQTFFFECVVAKQA